MTNHDLAQMIDTTDEWIVERSGIRERHIAADHESSSTMGTEAARIALDSAGLDGKDIDLVLAGTCTPDGLFPSVATLIQHSVGANRAGAFDVNAACTGFLSALSTAGQFIATGAAERALVVGTETLSRIVDWTDRGTCVLFGDGAGAVVVERAAEGEPGGIESLVLGSDGSQADLLYSHGPCTAPVALNGLAHEAKIVMDGRGIFRHAVTAMTSAAREALDEAGLTVDDIALCVPHQANIRILSAMARNLDLPMDRVFVNLDKYGNTSSATIPIALSEAVDEGRLQPGDKILFAAFGGGLSWGAMVFQWSGVRVTATATADATAAAPAS
jgi:3-oxoacyl-[acyl-carrier-protein] synthase-3